jgi:hypothetical protein
MKFREAFEMLKSEFPTGHLSITANLARFSSGDDVRWRVYLALTDERTIVEEASTLDAAVSAFLKSAAEPASQIDIDDVTSDLEDAFVAHA